MLPVDVVLEAAGLSVRVRAHRTRIHALYQVNNIKKNCDFLWSDSVMSRIINKTNKNNIKNREKGEEFIIF